MPPHSPTFQEKVRNFKILRRPTAVRFLIFLNCHLAMAPQAVFPCTSTLSVFQKTSPFLYFQSFFLVAFSSEFTEIPVSMETAAEDAAKKGLPTPIKEASESFSNERRVVYVVGGPGSGKGTQCSKIAKHFGFCHLNTGGLLEAEVESGSEDGKLIQALKKEGKLVPSELVVRLLWQAMQGSENKKFLIDGFPRNEENRVLAEKTLKVEPDFVLFLDCSEGEMIRRLLSRNQGRADDNIETIQKRLKVYQESTLPVINYYTAKGKVRKVDAEKSIDEVFESIKGIFTEPYGEQNMRSAEHKGV